MALATSQDMVDDTDIYYGETANVIVLGNEGNLVISGVAVTANVGSDLTNSGQDDVDIASGIVLVNNSIQAVTGAGLDLSVEYLALGASKSRYVYIYISDTGVISKIAGAIADTGQELPPLFSVLPSDLVLLSRVLLTQGDTVVNAGDLFELRMFTSDGSAYADSKKSYWGDGGDLQAYHDSANSFVVTSSTATGSFVIGTLGNDELIFRQNNGNRWKILYSVFRCLRLESL